MKKMSEGEKWEEKVRDEKAVKSDVWDIELKRKTSTGVETVIKGRNSDIGEID